MPAPQPVRTVGRSTGSAPTQCMLLLCQKQSAAGGVCSLVICCMSILIGMLKPRLPVGAGARSKWTRRGRGGRQVWRHSCRLPLCPKLPCNHCSCLDLEPNAHLAPPAAYRRHLAAGTSQRDPEPVPPPSSHTPRMTLGRSHRLFNCARGAWQAICARRCWAAGAPDGQVLRLGGRWPARSTKAPWTGSKRAPNDKHKAMAGCGSGTCVR